MSDTITMTLDSNVLEDDFWPQVAGSTARSGQWDADVLAAINAGFNDDGYSRTVVTKGLPRDYADSEDGKRAVRALRQAIANTCTRLTKDETTGKATKSIDSKVVTVTEAMAPKVGAEVGDVVLVWRLVPRRAQSPALAEGAKKAAAKKADAK